MPYCLFVDPGTTKSAYVIWDGSIVAQAGLVPNEEMLDVIESCPACFALVLEQVQSYGQNVSTSIFETVRWSGRFEDRWLTSRGGMVIYVPRKDIKSHLLGHMGQCGPGTADSQIIRVLTDRFGGKGTKKSPGFFYGFKADIWQAMALAVYFTDQMTMPFPNDQDLLQIQYLYQQSSSSTASQEVNAS